MSTYNESDPRVEPMRPISTTVSRAELMWRLHALQTDNVRVIQYPLTGGLEIEEVGQPPEADKAVGLDIGDVARTPVQVFDAAAETRDVPKRSTGEHFVQAVREVAFAASKDESRPALRGVFFDVQDDGVRLVGADGFRLIRSSKLPIPFVQDEVGMDVIVEAQALNRLAKKLSRAKIKIKKTEITLGINSQNSPSVFSLHTSTDLQQEWHTLPRIFGAFPNVEGLIPKSGNPVLFQREEFLDVLSQIDIDLEKPVDNLEMKDIIVIEPIQDGTTDVLLLRRIRHHNPFHERGTYEYDDRKALLPVSGKLDSRVALNVRYLAEVLRNVDSDSLTLTSGVAPEYPIAFRKPNDPDFVHVIMPLFVNWDEIGN